MTLYIEHEIRNEVFEIRDLVGAAVQKAKDAATKDAMEFIATTGITQDDARGTEKGELVKAQVSMRLAQIAHRANGTTHSADSIESFIQQQVVKHILRMSSDPSDLLLNYLFS